MLSFSTSVLKNCLRAKAKCMHAAMRVLLIFGSGGSNRTETLKAFPIEKGRDHQRIAITIVVKES